MVGKMKPLSRFWLMGKYANGKNKGVGTKAWPLDCEKALAQEDYRSLCAELINSIHASRCTQMGWTEEKEDELLKRAALAVGEGYFTPTAWNILAQ